jgi:hypothetical protein
MKLDIVEMSTIIGLGIVFVLIVLAWLFVPL